MNDFLSYITTNFSQIFSILGAGEYDPAFADFAKAFGKIMPILWIASAVVSTIWMIIKFVNANFQSATGDQAKYEQAKKARKRALFAWITGLLWPLILLLAWPIAGLIFNAITGKTLPKIFSFSEQKTQSVLTVISLLLP